MDDSATEDLSFYICRMGYLKQKVNHLHARHPEAGSES